VFCLQCFDTAAWASEKSIHPVKIEWWGVAICLERGANDLHMMIWSSWCHCHPIVSCSS